MVDREPPLMLLDVGGEAAVMGIYPYARRVGRLDD